ncbi:MAG: DUF3168 domain-containing protein [Allorhizobium sp.]
MTYDPSLALQTLIRSRMIGTPAVTALVAPDAITDRSTRPTAFPCIVLGEGQTLFADNLDRYHEQAFLSLHVWTKEPGLEQVKRISAAIRDALRESPWRVQGHIAHGVTVSSARYLHDPSGQHGHGVIAIDAVLQVAATDEFGEISP